MCTTRLPVVDWTYSPTNLNGLVRFAERRNLVSARVPSHFKHSLLQSNFVPALPWMHVFGNSNWLQCGGLEKQVYGNKKIKPTSSINNCAIAVGRLPHVLLFSFQHCSLLPWINFIHDCALLRQSVWPTGSIHLMRQKTSSWTNIYKNMKGKMRRGG